MNVAMPSCDPPGAALFGTASGSTGLPLQIMNMDVVTTARNVRAATLPQISWEPIWNIPLADRRIGLTLATPSP